MNGTPFSLIYNVFEQKLHKEIKKRFCRNWHQALETSEIG